MKKMKKALALLFFLITILLYACQPQVRITEKEIVTTTIATKASTVLPTHTPLPTHTALPTHTPYPRNIPTETPSIPSNTETIQMPAIADLTTSVPTYNRSEWSHWSDIDGDCQNTRHEVLITESISPVSFKSTSQCQVNTGLWYDPFVGTTVSVASQLDVDHMVPLHNAHLSGGWAWNASVKKAFAND